MKQLVWILVASHVVLGAGLFFGLAIDSPTVSLIAAALLALLVGPQRYLLSRRNGRPPEPGRVRGDRS